VSLVRTSALVLGTMEYGDSSRIVRVYTRAAGLQSLLARGVKQPRSRLRGVLDLFHLVEVAYVKKPGRTLHAPRDADLLEAWPRLRADLDRMVAFGAVVRLLAALSLDDDPNPDLFDAVVRAARAFDDPGLPADGVEPLRHFAAWRVLAGKGYAPEVDRCASCGAPAGARPAFAVAEGGVVCARCAAGRRALSTREYGALQLFLHGDEGLAASWRFAHGEARRLDRIREEFATWHAGVRPPPGAVTRGGEAR
jgi:DNA repair protein RecO (recombination protein O)